jgi:hypothetical protein
VKRAQPLLRPAGLALGLIALSATTGCAHFRNAHERVLREQGQEQQEQAAPPAPATPPAPPPPVQAAPVQAPPPAPLAPPAASPAPAVRPAPIEAPAPKPDIKAEKAAQKAQKAKDKAALRAQREESRKQAEPVPAPAAPETAPPAPQPAPVAAAPAPVAPAPEPATRQPVLEAPVTSSWAPEAPAAPAAVAAPAAAAEQNAAPASANAIVIFSNVTGGRCGDCQTLKISVAPSGKILIERGRGAEESWRYRRSVAHVRPDRAAAFAARLAAVRPLGKQVLAGGPACPAAQGDALAIEWIEAERHDELTVPLGCGARREDAAIAALLHAPDLLGLHQLDFPWSANR